MHIKIFFLEWNAWRLYYTGTCVRLTQCTIGLRAPVRTKAFHITPYYVKPRTKLKLIRCLQIFKRSRLLRYVFQDFQDSYIRIAKGRILIKLLIQLKHKLLLIKFLRMPRNRARLYAILCLSNYHVLWNLYKSSWDTSIALIARFPASSNSAC